MQFLKLVKLQKNYKQSMLITRLATVEDIPQLLPIINRAYREEGGWTTEANLVKEARIDEPSLKHVIESKGEILFSIEEDGVVHGCICLEYYNPDLHAVDEQGKSFLLGLFAVNPSVQGKGLGKRLVHCALDHAKQLLVKDIYMWVLECRQELLAWYYKQGFQSTGEKRDFVAPELLLKQDLKFLILKKSIE